MLLMHLSDLHIGRRLSGYSLSDDQKYILDQILDMARDERPDAVLIAGDVYDKIVPSGEAVTLFDDFLVSLNSLTGHVFVISGNHDAAERLAFARRLIEPSGVHMAPVFQDGKIDKYVLEDEFGPVDIFLLPYIRPAEVRQAWPDETIESTADAVRAAIAHMPLDPNRRSVLLSHQFVLGAVTSESETSFVGGTDSVPYDVYDPFDYVALGHLHMPQAVGRETVRYSGAPLKYALGERDGERSVTLVEMKRKGETALRTRPLKPLHELRQIRGTYDELAAKSFYESATEFKKDDYLHAVLTDENDVPDAMTKLRTIYPRLLGLSYDNTRTREAEGVSGAITEEERAMTPIDILASFYEQQNGMPMSDAQREYAQAQLDRIGRELNP